MQNFWYACDQHSRYQSAQANRDVKSEICPLSQLSSTSGSTQRPVPIACCLFGWLEGDCIRCPIMDGNSDGRCIDILPMHLKHLFLKARVETYPVQEKWFCLAVLWSSTRSRTPCQLFHLFSTMRPVCHQAIEPANYARLIDANIDFAHAIAIHKKPLVREFHCY